ncbi:DUF1003 domain-containing protein [Elioraea rosea]|uniref:DUF1003 domain-containing protein n=1 Tax=Elioraea rosea TaxID=2492390 RepID=UPI001183E2FC|nr:DUF1003 domain-containing protein [Elioraea rosea]
MTLIAQPHHLTPAEAAQLSQLRHRRRTRRVVPQPAPARTRGQVLADAVAATVGSWRFIGLQSALIALWILVNTLFGGDAWDPYPFILLNLLLSFQAAYTAPAIMMSQNRQAEVDRSRAMADYDVNVKAELEIELLHQKIDLLRERELLALTELLRETIKRLDAQQRFGPQSSV